MKIFLYYFFIYKTCRMIVIRMFTSREENHVDLDQLASQKPADLDHSTLFSIWDMSEFSIRHYDITGR